MPCGHMKIRCLTSSRAANVALVFARLISLRMLPQGRAGEVSLYDLGRTHARVRATPRSPLAHADAVADAIARERKTSIIP